ncbi:hypothetical protein BE15_19440 [Sorangium cellulosum]|uniref:Uncharacterized protein n=1 Tax=Sorangium cellulosum TaxID=56 RepID=A0A150QQN6_SORCE|nr:hypothetical protein BE15_19440 [Sorangium cellulosum]
MPRLTVNLEHVIVNPPVTASPLAAEVTSASAPGSELHPAAAIVAVRHTRAWRMALRIARTDVDRME